MREYSKALDVLHDAIDIGFFMNRKKGYDKPGAVIQRLPKERREVLATLRSEDTRNELL